MNMGVTDVNGLVTSEMDVMAKPTRRRYTAEYKHRILREADAYTSGGGSPFTPRGAVLL